MGYRRQSPELGDDMIFAVGYVDNNKGLTHITDGPYAKVGPARAMVGRNNKTWRPKDGKYKLLATAVEWVVVE